MNENRTYTITKSRMQGACMQGMYLAEDALICMEEEPVRFAFFGMMDNVEEEIRWGRFSAELKLGSEMSYSFHVISSQHKEFMRKGKLTEINKYLLDKTIPAAHKQEFFRLAGEVVFVDKPDFLLYDLTGRYLWFYIKVIGRGMGRLRQMQLRLPGDNFMNTYPQVYREWGSFFHRYLSIFSSLYNDFHKEIKRVNHKIDPDTAPKELLIVLAGWMGIDVSGNFLEEDTLRTLVKESHELNRMKGTQKAVARVAEIVLGEKVIILERGKLKGQVRGGTDYEVIILIQHYLEEKRKFQLLFLLKQFIPIRCSIRIIFLDYQNLLDTYCCLDMNAVIFKGCNGILDQHERMDYRAMLK